VIRTQVCWDATVRIVLGLVVAAVGVVAADALYAVTLIGWVLALTALVPTLLFGVFMVTKGLWLVVEEAAREAVHGRPRSEVLTEE
jgi:ABC-type transport system involved in cytochrome bd biosynthesis fused ATPase/permease subunit